MQITSVGIWLPIWGVGIVLIRSDLQVFPCPLHWPVALLLAPCGKNLHRMIPAIRDLLDAVLQTSVGEGKMRAKLEAMVNGHPGSSSRAHQMMQPFATYSSAPESSSPAMSWKDSASPTLKRCRKVALSPCRPPAGGLKLRRTKSEVGATSPIVEQRGSPCGFAPRLAGILDTHCHGVLHVARYREPYLQVDSNFLPTIRYSNQ